MSSNVTAALDAWRRAEKDSRDVEALFGSALTDYTNKSGPEVSSDMVRLVAHSRQRANALLTEALCSLKPQVK